jgi:hypothetical protein
LMNEKGERESPLLATYLMINAKVVSRQDLWVSTEAVS